MPFANALFCEEPTCNTPSPLTYTSLSSTIAVAGSDYRIRVRDLVRSEGKDERTHASHETTTTPLGGQKNRLPASALKCLYRLNTKLRPGHSWLTGRHMSTVAASFRRVVLRLLQSTTYVCSLFLRDSTGLSWGCRVTPALREKVGVDAGLWVRKSLDCFLFFSFLINLLTYFRPDPPRPVLPSISDGAAPPLWSW